VHEEYNTEKQRFILHFLWAKGLNAKNIHEEIIPLYGGKCLLHRAIHKWVEKFSQGQYKVSDYETEVRNWLRQRSKYFRAVGFGALVKKLGKYVNVHMFYVLYPFVTYLLTLPRMCTDHMTYFPKVSGSNLCRGYA
jgi:hypothetical protein